VELNDRVEAGNYPIGVIFHSEEGEKIGQETFQLEVLGAKLPKQELLHTHWFHTDCIATYYDVEAFSERHWQLIEEFVKTTVKYGSNMLLTPLFTPPLDTAIGHE